MNKQIRETELLSSTILDQITGSGAQVGIVAKAIANDAEMIEEGLDKGKVRLKLVLQFTPVGATNTNNKSDLSVLPSGISKILRKLKVEMTPANQGSPPKIDGPITFSKHDAANIDFNSRDKLWQRLMLTKLSKTSGTKDETLSETDALTLWRELAGSISKAATGQGLGVNLKKEDGTSQDSGKQSKQISSILVNEQRIQAVSLELTRAYELVESLNGVDKTIEVEASKALCDKAKACLETAKEKKPVEDVAVPPNDPELSKEAGEKLLQQAREIELEGLRQNWFDAARKAGSDDYVSSQNIDECTSKMEPSAAPSNPAENENSATLANESQKYLDGHAYSTWQNQIDPKQDAASNSALETQRDAAERRFFNVQSTPALSRLFCLTVDAEVTAHEADFTFDADGKVHFWLAVKIDGEVAKMRTLVKLEKYGKNSLAFWPAQKSELNSNCAALTDQSRGVVQMASLLRDNKTPRFDLTSLHVTAATEKAYERSRRRAAASKEAIASENLRTEQRETYHTGGFAILDGRRRMSVALRLAAREKQNQEISHKQQLSLDANDLLAGFAIDVGVGIRTPEPNTFDTKWRPLMYRKIGYGEQDDQLNKLIGKSAEGEAEKENERMLLDMAIISPPIKLGEVPSSGPPTKTEQTGDANSPQPEERQCIADELIATWDGGPMGVNCAGDNKDKTDNEELPFSRDFDLPTGSKLRPLHLRFGRAYRFGMRVVYQGGVVTTLDRAEVSYNDGEAFPPLPDRSENHFPFRRFLRQERLGPPNMLLPASRAYVANGKMGYETAKLAVIRSMLDEKGALQKDGDRATPDATHRYFMPPGIDQALAAMHGIFDGQASPISAAKNIVTNPENGGFPAVENIMSEGLNNEPYIDKRAYVKPNDGRQIHGPAESVFATGEPPAGQAYYPDPMAETYVLGLRYLESSTYVKVQSHDIYDESKNLRPLKISVMKAGQGRPAGLSEFQDVKVLEPLQSGAKAKEIPALEVVLTLAQGQDFEIDVWCIPSAASLAKHFMLVETLGMLALKKGDETFEGYQRLHDGWKKLFPLGQKFDGIKSFEGKIWNTYDGPFGMKVPCQEAMLQIADVLVKCMNSAPLRELTATASFRAVHAVNRPKVTRPFPYGSQINARYFTSKHFQSLLKGGKEHDPAPVADPCYYPDEGGHDLCLTGPVGVDFHSAGGFKIHAKTVFPRTTDFDHESRGRSAIDRRTGSWPIEVHLERNPKTGQLESVQRYTPTAAIYGFHVQRSGTVILQPTSVTLLSVTGLTPENVSREQPEPVDEQLWRLLELKELYRAVQPPTPDQTNRNPLLKNARVQLEHAFPDGKARKLELSLETLTRYSSLMTTAPGRAFKNSAKPLRAFEPATPLNDDEDFVDVVLPKPVWLEATTRPSKPDAATPIHVFTFKDGGPSSDPKFGPNTRTFETTRQSTIRIPLKRGWFSSGQEEKLGIVLWPPNLFELDDDTLKGNVLKVKGHNYSGTGDVVGIRNISLADFSDDDLGPGGPFITRMGQDPIRGGGQQHGQFVSWQRFADRDTCLTLDGYAKADGESNKPLKIENVKMPLRMPASNHGESKDAAQKKDANTSTDEHLQFMTVSLLAYTPQFDVDAEEWFVDVNFDLAFAPDPFVRLGLVRYQPHAPKFLQLSEPIVEWVQPLPTRTITLFYNADGPAGLGIEVNGLSYDGAQIEKAFGGNKNLTLQIPQMKFQLIAEINTEYGIVRHVLAELQCTDSYEVSGQRRWRGELSLGDEGVSENTTLYVNVIEFERRPRAWSNNEPVRMVPDERENPNRDELLQNSGPRFMSRIEVPIEWIKGGLVRRVR